MSNNSEACDEPETLSDLSLLHRTDLLERWRHDWGHEPPVYISRTLPIAFLAPDITRAILLGNQLVDLTAEQLKRTGRLPACWQEQRRLLGVIA